MVSDLEAAIDFFDKPFGGKHLDKIKNNNPKHFQTAWLFVKLYKAITYRPYVCTSTQENNHEVELTFWNFINITTNK